MAKYEQMQVKNRKDVTQDGKPYTKFKAVLRYREINPAFVDKPKGEDTRKASEKRRYVWREVAKTMQVDRNPRSKKQTDANVMAALQQWRDEMEELASRPEDAVLKVPDYVQTFVDNKTGKNGKKIATSTADTYKYAMKHIHHRTLDKPLSDLTHRDVELWLRTLRSEGKGESIMDKSFRLLKSALKKARKNKLITDNPCDYIEDANDGKPIPTQSKVHALDEDGLRKVNTLLDVIGHTQMADCARFALLTGMRAGEICGLRWKDVDGWRDGKFDGSIHLRNVIARDSGGQVNKAGTKNGTERSIAINRPMAEVLEVRRQTMMEECAKADTILLDFEYVFGTPTSVEGTGFFSPNYLSKLWHAFAVANNVKTLEGDYSTFHSLRHTYATHALASGIPAVDVSQVLGHRDPSVTERIYTDYLPNRTGETQKRMAEVMTKREKQAPIEQFHQPTGTDN